MLLLRSGNLPLSVVQIHLLPTNIPSAGPEIARIKCRFRFLSSLGDYTEFDFPILFISDFGIGIVI